MRKKSNILNRETSKQRNCEGMKKPIKRKRSNTSLVAVVAPCSSKVMSKDEAGKAVRTG